VAIIYDVPSVQEGPIKIDGSEVWEFWIVAIICDVPSR